MAKNQTRTKSGSSTEHKAHWQQPWVRRVMNGGYNSFEKLLFMRINSFGVSGCWMENETIAEDLGCCERCITRAITKLWKGKELWITGWNNDRRKIYAAGNPEVKTMAEEWYKKENKAGKVQNWTEFYEKHNVRGKPA